MKIMISGNEVTLRKALLDDIDKIKALVDQHKTELGFIIRPALIKSIQSGELIVAINPEGVVIGLVHYHHRKDGQTTLYNVVVRSDYQHNGIGSALVNFLKNEADHRGQKSVLLKCPTTLPANGFYEKLNFRLQAVEDGKKRALNIWNLDL